MPAGSSRQRPRSFAQRPELASWNEDENSDDEADNGKLLFVYKNLLLLYMNMQQEKPQISKA